MTFFSIIKDWVMKPKEKNEEEIEVITQGVGTPIPTVLFPCPDVRHIDHACACMTCTDAYKCKLEVNYRSCCNHTYVLQCPIRDNLLRAKNGNKETERF